MSSEKIKELWINLTTERSDGSFDCFPVKPGEDYNKPHLMKLVPKSAYDEAMGILNLSQDEYVKQVGTWKIIQRLEEERDELKTNNETMSKNCISLSLHDSRVWSLEKSIKELQEANKALLQLAGRRADIADEYKNTALRLTEKNDELKAEVSEACAARDQWYSTHLENKELKLKLSQAGFIFLPLISGIEDLNPKGENLDEAVVTLKCSRGEFNRAIETINDINKVQQNEALPEQTRSVFNNYDVYFSLGRTKSIMARNEEDAILAAMVNCPDSDVVVSVQRTGTVEVRYNYVAIKEIAGVPHKVLKGINS